MKQHITQLPTRLEAAGVCIQAHDWSELNVARIRFPNGADATPLLEGLPGHTVWVDEDYEALEFSPSEAMCQVIDHLNSKLSN